MWMNKGFRKEDKEEGKIKQRKSRGTEETRIDQNRFVSMKTRISRLLPMEKPGLEKAQGSRRLRPERHQLQAGVYKTSAMGECHFAGLEVKSGSSTSTDPFSIRAR